MERFSLRQRTQSGLSRDTVIQARRGARVHPDSRARLEETREPTGASARDQKLVTTSKDGSMSEMAIFNSYDSSTPCWP